MEMRLNSKPLKHPTAAAYRAIASFQKKKTMTNVVD